MLEAALLKYIRGHSIKMTWLARRANINYYPLNQSLNGKRELRASELLSICRALDISIDEFDELDFKETEDGESIKEADDA